MLMKGPRARIDDTSPQNFSLVRFNELTIELRYEFERLEILNKELHARFENPSSDHISDDHLGSETAKASTPRRTEVPRFRNITSDLENAPMPRTGSKYLGENVGQVDLSKVRPPQLHRVVARNAVIVKDVVVKEHSGAEKMVKVLSNPEELRIRQSGVPMVSMATEDSNASFMEADLSHLSATEHRWWKITTTLLESLSICYQLNESWQDPYSIQDSDSELSFSSRMDGITRAYEYLHGQGSQKSSTRLSRDIVPTTHQRFRGAWSLHPNSRARYIWNLAALFLAGYDFFRVTLDIYRPGRVLFFELVDWFRRIFYSADIVISFRTGFFTHKILQLNQRQIAARYIKTYLPWDATALFFDWLSWILVLSGLVQVDTIAFTCLGLVRFFRWRKCPSLATACMERVNSIPYILLVHLVGYFLAMCLWVHVSGCAWYLIGESEPDGWTRVLVDRVDSPAKAYWASIHWAVVQLQGSTEITVGGSLAERVYAVFDVLLCICFLAMFIGKLTNSLLQLQYNWSASAKHLRAIRLYMEKHQIPTELAVQVRKYAEWKLSMDNDSKIPEEKLLGILPNNLRRQLITETHSPRLFKHVVFFAIHELNARFIERVCCDLVERSTYEPDETIFSYGETCSCMYFHVSGDLQYVVYSSIIEALVLATGGGLSRRSTSKRGAASVFSMGPATDYKRIREGQWLCEPCLYTNWSHKGDLLCDSHICVIKLDAGHFGHLVDSYPMVRRFGACHAARFVKMLNTTKKNVSDQFDSVLAIKGMFAGMSCCSEKMGTR